MVDNVQITSGSGTSVATDDVAGVHYQIVKEAFGPLDIATLVTATVGKPVNLVQVGGTAAATGNGVTGAGSQRVTIASDQTAFALKEQTSVARVVRNFMLDTFTAAPLVEAMQLVVQWYNNAAVAATVSPAVVPAGKILRLTGGQIESKSLATFGSVVCRIRCNTAGTAVIGSPLAGAFSCGAITGATTVSATGGFEWADFTFGDDGLEFPANAGIGFSLAGYGPTGVLALQGVTRFTVYGYEYTA